MEGDDTCTQRERRLECNVNKRGANRLNADISIKTGYRWYSALVSYLDLPRPSLHFSHTIGSGYEFAAAHKSSYRRMFSLRGDSGFRVSSYSSFYWAQSHIAPLAAA